jgi:hypothetical protein
VVWKRDTGKGKAMFGRKAGLRLYLNKIAAVESCSENRSAVYCIQCMLARELRTTRE